MARPGAFPVNGPRSRPSSPHVSRGWTGAPLSSKNAGACASFPACPGSSTVERRTSERLAAPFCWRPPYSRGGDAANSGVNLRLNCDPLSLRERIIGSEHFRSLDAEQGHEPKRSRQHPRRPRYGGTPPRGRAIPSRLPPCPLAATIVSPALQPRCQIFEVVSISQKALLLCFTQSKREHADPARKLSQFLGVLSFLLFLPQYPDSLQALEQRTLYRAPSSYCILTNIIGDLPVVIAKLRAW